MKKDLTIVGLVFILIIQLAISIKDNIQKEKLTEKLIELKQVNSNLNEDNNNYIFMLDNMNKYADQLENQINKIEQTDKLLKELRVDRRY